MPPVITLTTDFGLSDGYVAAMKGVILSINPSAVIVDVTHHVPPRDIFHGAYVLSTMWEVFPKGTVHVAVVDPGVGSERRAIAMASAGHLFVGPDNGVLSLAPLGDTPLDAPPLFEAMGGPLPPACEAVELTERRYWRREVSATFHGRDIFAPAAAYLSLGVALASLGPRTASLRRFSLGAPVATGGTIEGAIVHVDAFGNAASNIRPQHLPSGEAEVTVGGARIRGISPSYAGGGDGPLALWGSNGTLEIAIPDGNAARELRLSRGERVWVGPARSPRTHRPSRVL